MRHHHPAKEYRQLRGDLDRLRSDVNALSGSVYQYTGERFRDAANGVEERVRRGNERIVRGVERIDERGRGVCRSTHDALASRPFTTAAVAFGLGYAVATVYGAARRFYRRRQMGQPHRVDANDVGMK